MTNDSAKQSPRLRLVVGRTLADLLPHAEQWDQLALVQPQKIPFLTYGWTSAHIEYLLPNESHWLCLFAYDGDTLVGVLPVEIVKQRIFGIKVTVVRGLRHSHSYSYDFITTLARADEVREFLIASLASVIPNWTVFQVNRIPEQSPTVAFVQVKHTALHIITRIDGVGAYLPTVGSYDEYLKTLSDNFSSNLRKRKKKLDKLSGVRFEIVNRSSDIVPYLEKFIQVESAGWKGEGKSSIGSNERLIAFYTKMARSLNQLGILELHFLYQEDKVIAGHCAVHIADLITVMKMGYDESYSDCAPGSMVLDQLNRRCFADETVVAANWLSDMPWHRNWRFAHWTYYNFAFYRFTALGWLLYTLDTVKRRLAKVVLAQRVKVGLFMASKYFHDLFADMGSKIEDWS